MHRTLSTLISSLLVVAAAGAISCSSTSGGGGGADTTCDTTKPVSFKADIFGGGGNAIGIFPGSCGLSSACHQTGATAMVEHLFIANAPMDGNMDADIKMSHDALVNVKAQESPMMNMVTPGDPDNSYLWHKVNGDIDLGKTSAALSAGCASVASCADCTAADPCGGRMPYMSVVLSPDQICTIKSWIVQGAMNN